MANNDSPTLVASDMVEAIGLLTRLPVRLGNAPRGAAAAWAYPVAGLVVAAIGVVVAWLGTGLPPMVTAGLVLAAMTFVTGALHEDGLADTVDGFWGGWDRERRLAIMKDSHIGTFGVLALIFSVAMRWGCLAALAGTASIWWVIIVFACVSRTPMVVVMHVLPNARGAGLSSQTGRPNAQTTAIAVSIAFLIAALSIGLSAIGLTVVLGITTLVLMALARRKIGGQTGDVLGATQQVSEIAILIFLLA